MRRAILATAVFSLLAASAALGICPQPNIVEIELPATQFAVGATVPVTGRFTTDGYNALCNGKYLMTWHCVSGSFSFTGGDSPLFTAYSESTYVGTHVFDTPGVYTLRIAVADSANSEEIYSDTLTVTVGGASPVRDLDPSDFQYLGAFRTGAAAGDTAHGADTRADLFCFGAPSQIFYTQTGDTVSDGFTGLLWAQGFTSNGNGYGGNADTLNGTVAVNCGGKVCALKIPVPVIHDNPDSLPIAAIAQTMRHVAWPYFNMTVGGQQHLDGIWVDERNANGTVTSVHSIYSHTWDYYNSATAVDDRPTWIKHTLADTTTEGTVHWGAYIGCATDQCKQGPTFANKYSAYSIQGIPDAWIEQFIGPGKWIAGGSGAREGGYAVCGGAVYPVDDKSRIYAGNGPSLGLLKVPSVFPDSGDAVLDLETLLCYNERKRFEPRLPPLETAAGDTLNDMDRFHGGAWIDTEWARGLVFLGQKCLYSTHYNCPGYPDGGVCAEHNQGFKCGLENVDGEPAYEQRLYCYRIADMEAVANGNKDYNDVQPVWRMTMDQWFLPFSCEEACFDCTRPTGGMAWDAVHHLLFIAQGSVDATSGGGFDPSAIIHVWRVADEL